MVVWAHDIALRSRAILIVDPVSLEWWPVPIRAFFYQLRSINGYGLDPYGLERQSLARSFVFNSTVLFFSLSSFKVFEEKKK